MESDDKVFIGKSLYYLSFFYQADSIREILFSRLRAYLL